VKKLRKLKNKLKTKRKDNEDVDEHEETFYDEINFKDLLTFKKFRGMLLFLFGESILATIVLLAIILR
jgi:hypothetical protein